jgi:hypothetical protein
MPTAFFLSLEAVVAEKIHLSVKDASACLGQINHELLLTLIPAKLISHFQIEMGPRPPCSSKNIRREIE